MEKRGRGEMHRRSPTAKILASIYLALCCYALVTLLRAPDGASLGGAYLILLCMPWSLLLLAVIGYLGIDSVAFNAIFLGVGVILNIGLLASLSRRRPEPSGENAE